MVFKGDKVLWYVVITLMLVSLVVIYSSTGRLAYSEQEGNTMYYLMKQLFLVGGCFLVLFVMQSINYRFFNKYAGWVLLISAGLLLFAAVGGANINGAGRWIRIPLIGLTFQPSELAKIGIMMFAARIITFAQSDYCCEDYAFRKFLIYVGPVILIVFMDNFSTSALLGMVCFILFIVGRLRWKLLLGIFGAVVGLAGLMVLLLLYVPQVENVGRLATVKNRVISFTQDNEEDVNGYSNQSVQAKIAVAKGGLMGKGPGNGMARNVLPHSYSDFIYAIIIEEYGLVGGGFIMLLYLIILFRVGVIVRRCTRIYPALLVTGLGLTIVLQAMINMGVCVGFFPVTGQTLPLVSMGGTSLWFTSASFGIILSISHTFSEEGEAEEQERQRTKDGGREGRNAGCEPEAEDELDDLEDKEVVSDNVQKEKYRRAAGKAEDIEEFNDWENDPPEGVDADIEKDLEESGRKVLKEIQKKGRKEWGSRKAEK